MSSLMNKKGVTPCMISSFFNVFVMAGHLVLLLQIVNHAVIQAHLFELLLIGAGLIALPCVLMFGVAGMIADRFDKARVLQCCAWGVLLSAVWLLLCHGKGWFWVSYGSVMLLSIERSVSAPARSGYMRHCCSQTHIARGNAFHVFFGSMALLLSVVVFCGWYDLAFGAAKDISLQSSVSQLTKLAFSPSILLVIAAIGQVIVTYQLPPCSALDKEPITGVKAWLKTPSLRQDIQSIRKNKVVVACLVGVMSFWATSTILFIVFPQYAQEQFLAISSLGYFEIIVAGLFGMILGALYAGHLSRLFIESGYIIIAAIGLTVILLVLPWIKPQLLIVAFFFVYGYFGGLLLVPINALVQFGLDTPHIGRVSSVIRATLHLLIVLSVALSVVAINSYVSTVIILRLIFVIALLVAAVSMYCVPQGLIRCVIYLVATRFFKMDVHGLNNMPSAKPVLMLGNHTSYVDWAIVQLASPRPVRFVMSRDVYEKWYLKMILKAFDIIPISKAMDEASIQVVVDALNNNEVVALFPERYLCSNGQMGTFHADFEKILARVTTRDVSVIPFYIRGLWGTGASRATERYKAMSKIKTRQVSIFLGDPLPTHVTAPEVKKSVFELSILSWKTYADSLGCLQSNWLRTAKRMANELCVADSAGIQLSHHKFMVAVLLVAKRIKKTLLGQNNVGLLLPTSAGGAIANMALFTLGKTVVNLNYTAGAVAVQNAIESAGIRTIVTARVFAKKLKARGIDWDAMVGDTPLIYLEDIKKQNSTAVALRFLLYVKLLPWFVLQFCFIKTVPSNKTAAIMFSSGSEGKPKGVELSHANLMANIKQVISIFNIEDTDTFISILPLFHCFGLTVNALLPLVSGATFVCHPDPTDSVAVGHLVYRYKATILCGSSTFFGLYARSPKLHALMFKSLRMAVAGAEKLSPQVRQAFKDKFIVDILEGYGTTEVAPVASCNLPDNLNAWDWHVQVSNKVGSVGLPLPGSAFRILDPDTLEVLEQGQEGMIAVGGPQVMKGYLNDPNKTDQVLVTDQSTTWYLTGDKGYLDKEGYLYIVDRYSRFAKIGGEMVSLAVVEQGVLTAIDQPDADAMAVTVSDDRKGERIAVMYHADMDVDTVKRAVTASNMAKLAMPAFYFSVDELPKLASGKKDYVTAKTYVHENLIKGRS